MSVRGTCSLFTILQTLFSPLVAHDRLCVIWDMCRSFHFHTLHWVDLCNYYLSAVGGLILLRREESTFGCVPLPVESRPRVLCRKELPYWSTGQWWLSLPASSAVLQALSCSSGWSLGQLLGVYDHITLNVPDVVWDCCWWQEPTAEASPSWLLKDRVLLYLVWAGWWSHSGLLKLKQAGGPPFWWETLAPLRAESHFTHIQHPGHQKENSNRKTIAVP